MWDSVRAILGLVCEGKVKKGPKKISMATYELMYMADLALSVLFVFTFFDEGKVVILNSVYQENFIFPILYYII